MLFLAHSFVIFFVISCFSGLIAFDTEYQDPEMFVSGTPKMDLHASIRQGSKSGSFVVKQPTVSPKVPLRQAVSSCQDDRRATYDKVQQTTREV